MTQIYVGSDLCGTHLLGRAKCGLTCEVVFFFILLICLNLSATQERAEERVLMLNYKFKLWVYNFQSTICTATKKIEDNLSN